MCVCWQNTWSGRDTMRMSIPTISAQAGHLPTNPIFLPKKSLHVSLTKWTGVCLSREARIDDDLVREFMAWIETTRTCSIATRNQRLAAIHAFFRYMQTLAPEKILVYQRILAIPLKKTGTPHISYLTQDALESILRQPDRHTSAGRRDLVLLAVLYDSGARVSELTELLVRDVRLAQPATITLRGKGRKVRHVPLMGRTASLLSDYM